MEDKTLETLKNLNDNLPKKLDGNISDFERRNIRAQIYYIGYLMNVMYGTNKDIDNLNHMFVNYSLGAVREYSECYSPQDIYVVFEELTCWSKQIKLGG